MLRFAIAHTHTQWHTFGRTPLDEGSGRRTDLYLTTHNTHKRRTSMPPAGFDPANPSSRAAPDPRLSAATGIGYETSHYAIAHAMLFTTAYPPKKTITRRITIVSVFFIGPAIYRSPTNKHQHQTAIRMNTSIIKFKNTPLTSYTRNKKSITGLGLEIFILWPKTLST